MMEYGPHISSPSPRVASSSPEKTGLESEYYKSDMHWQHVHLAQWRTEGVWRPGQ
jgi:hypothetical protein